jgi:hypothetical protein
MSRGCGGGESLGKSGRGRLISGSNSASWIKKKGRGCCHRCRQHASGLLPFCFQSYTEPVSLGLPSCLPSTGIEHCVSLAE